MIAFCVLSYRYDYSNSNNNNNNNNNINNSDIVARLGDVNQFLRVTHFPVIPLRYSRILPPAVESLNVSNPIASRNSPR